MANLTKEEKIIRLRRGIASPSTPAHLKTIMEEDLKALEAPEPEPKEEPITPPKKATKRPYKRKEPKKEKETIIEQKIETPPVKAPTPEEKAAKIAEYNARRERKKQRENQ